MSVPEGRDEYEERVTRWTYPDGTVTDSPPVRQPHRAGIAGLINAFTKPYAPMTGGRTFLRRTVVTVATPWEEVENEPDPAGDVRGD